MAVGIKSDHGGGEEHLTGGPCERRPLRRLQADLWYCIRRVNRWRSGHGWSRQDEVSLA